MTDLEELDDKIYVDRTKVLKSLAKGADMAMQELEDKLSHNLRITAALKALDLANLNINDYDIHDPKLDDILFAQRTVQDAAFDMAAEIVKLRKWQEEALPFIAEWLAENCGYGDPKMKIGNRLYTEAKETQE